MRVFGMGTLASMANRERYVRFTSALYGVYSTMERELDECCEEVKKQQGGERVGNHTSTSAVASFWSKHSTTLRRAYHLKKDVVDACRLMDTSSQRRSCGQLPELDKDDDSIYSPATIDYMNAIREAGRNDREKGTGRLLGHAYTRYLADLMGGSVLGTPTRVALRLDEGMPTQYSFIFPAASVSVDHNSDVAMSRKEYVECIYSDLNEAGKILEEKKGDRGADNGVLLEEVVSEAREAFRHNVNVYAEEPIVFDSIVGLKNIVTGWAMQK